MYLRPGQMSFNSRYSPYCHICPPYLILIPVIHLSLIHISVVGEHPLFFVGFQKYSTVALKTKQGILSGFQLMCPKQFFVHTFNPVGLPVLETFLIVLFWNCYHLWVTFIIMFSWHSFSSILVLGITRNHKELYLVSTRTSIPEEFILSCCIKLPHGNPTIWTLALSCIMKMLQNPQIVTLLLTVWSSGTYW